MDGRSLCTDETHTSGWTIHSEITSESESGHERAANDVVHPHRSFCWKAGSLRRPTGNPSRAPQFAAGLAAGALVVGEPEGEEDESEELDDSFVEFDEESLSEEFDGDETVLELLARESVA